MAPVETQAAPPPSESGGYADPTTPASQRAGPSLIAEKQKKSSLRKIFLYPWQQITYLKKSHSGLYKRITIYFFYSILF